MPNGQIIKAISGFYYVQTKAGEVIQCRARGIFKFKKKQKSLLVGDWVQFDVTGLNEGVITFVQPRQTELLRPPIANVDQAVVVCSLVQPDFSPMPLDRLLVQTEHAGLETVICLTKRDLIHDLSIIDEIKEIYGHAGYMMIITSIETGEGVEELREQLRGHTTVFAGQSGVGKSSLLNVLIPELQLETGRVSHRLGRGRHTTRQVELLSLPAGGQVADTPGFSQLQFQFPIDELVYAFPEFLQYVKYCKYRGCTHTQEDGCELREAVSNGFIHQLRYQHYLQFAEEIHKQRRY
ncbi:ribosome biogenesis GTPase [Seinonella peptonophila]|uniref:Small ribosomal subunit biogenesis GTPase RsgA n=1 Tax=Seinonella peptonophila TaxID=112248 RepID=A0A1M4UVH5_9BACL|nr:ribosome small subunit-dependent GTPase A [Seinonella peptonophila]SHE60694.1 ribosome biogenesis GTPase [Seinonella peptonophila]